MIFKLLFSVQLRAFRFRAFETKELHHLNEVAIESSKRTMLALGALSISLKPRTDTIGADKLVALVAVHGITFAKLRADSAGEHSIELIFAFFVVSLSLESIEHKLFNRLNRLCSIIVESNEGSFKSDMHAWFDEIQANFLFIFDVWQTLLMSFLHFLTFLANLLHLLRILGTLTQVFGICRLHFNLVSLR